MSLQNSTITAIGILRPLSQGLKSRFRFGVYDIETPGKDSLKFHSCGFFDGKRYHYFRNMNAFLSHVLTKRFDGWRFFAHFGGRFDVHYVFDWLRRHEPQTQIEINCAGSCVISLTVRQGKRRWRFCDSYRLLPKSLLTLTHDFDVEHKKLEGLEFTDRLYNEHDCRGLYEVLTQFFDEFDITSETIAAHAMRIFRTHFLQREIWQPRRDIEDFVRRCYFGGRCEIYRFDKRELNHYDVNSLYPKAMLGPVPVEYLCQTKRIPDDDSQIGFYAADVNVKDCYMPRLPARVDKLYFPVGRFSGFFTSIELREAIAAGAAVTVRAGKVFAAEPLLTEFVETLYSMKQAAEREGHNGRRYVMKTVLNSFYGKTAQRREQRSYLVDDGSPGLYPLPGGLAWKWTESHAGHILPHIGAAITSRARTIQFDYLSRSPVWYTDTDSLFTESEFPTDDEIGALKFEGRGCFEAYRLKEYRFQERLKVKGVPQKEKADQELAERYLQGEAISFDRMAGFLESMRAGEKSVRRVVQIKQRHQIRDKRARSGEWDTRPWNAKELFA